MKIGLIYCAYNTIEYVEDTLKPWQQSQADKLGNHEWLISVVNVPFTQYKEMNLPEDGTRAFLREEFNKFRIDYLFTEPEFVEEATARNLALQPLLEAKCDTIIMIDSDEFFTIQQIANIFEFIKLNPWESWYAISYKNFVFNKDTYLTEPFTPPRIFKVKTNGYTLRRYYYDNDITYQLDGKDILISYKGLPNKIIPSTVSFVRHLTWLNDEKSRQKILYQNSRQGWVCGYRWDEKEGLKFNEQFYLTNSLMLPRIEKDT